MLPVASAGSYTMSVTMRLPDTSGAMLLEGVTVSFVNDGLALVPSIER